MLPLYASNVPSEPGPLSAEEVEQFIEQGFVWVRRAFSPADAARVVESVLGEGGTAGPCTIVTPGGRREVDVRGLPLERAQEWPAARVNVDTRFGVPIAEFAPRLYGALRQLGGPRLVADLKLARGWILKARPEDEDSPCPIRDLPWHIDAPGPDTHIVGRTDALTLFVLWSDLDPRGGGTMYSAAAFDRFVNHVLEHPQGVDTDARGTWTAKLLHGIDDARPLEGKAGDVLITHAWMLHSATLNFSSRVRVLGNPMVRVDRALDYSVSNPEPSAIELAVIRRMERKGAELRVPTVVQEREQTRRRANELVADWCDGSDSERRERYDLLLEAWVSESRTRARRRGTDLRPKLRMALKELRAAFVVRSSESELAIPEVIASAPLWIRMLGGVLEPEDWFMLLRAVVEGEGTRSFALPNDRAAPRLVLQNDDERLIVDAKGNFYRFEGERAAGVELEALPPLELPTEHSDAPKPARRSDANVDAAWPAWMKLRTNVLIGDQPHVTAAYDELLDSGKLPTDLAALVAVLRERHQTP